MHDLISRKEAIDAHYEYCNKHPDAGFPVWSLKILEDLPSAQPEMNLDEWCTDCREYDKERHCCPRWNRVIRTTFKDMKEEQPEIIRCRDCKHWDKTWTNNWSPDYHYCPKIDEVRKGDFYCRYAERRTDDLGRISK